MSLFNADPAVLELSLTLAISIAVASGAILAARWSARWVSQRNADRAEEKRLKNLLQSSLHPAAWAEVWAKLLGADLARDRRKIIAAALADHNELFPLDRPIDPVSSSDAELQPQTDWEARLVAIESRLPGRQIVDQVASANEARMATQIEHLYRSLDEVKSSMPKKGEARAEAVNATLAVLAVLAGIAAIIAWVLTAITAG